MTHRNSAVWSVVSPLVLRVLYLLLTTYYLLLHLLYLLLTTYYLLLYLLYSLLACAALTYYLPLISYCAWHATPCVYYLFYLVLIPHLLQIIEIVLATDLSRHFEFIEKVGQLSRQLLPDEQASSYSLMLTTYYLRLTAYCLLLTTYYLLLTAYY